MKKPYFLYIINSAGICLFSYNFKKDIEMFPSDIFNYNYITEPLNNGTYTINVFWISTLDPSGDNYLSMANPTHNYTRSLWVTELRAQ